MNSIIKRPPESRSAFDRFVLAMFILYVTRPRESEPNTDGSFYIGEVGEARLDNQRLQRDTPYSICKGIRD